MFNYDTLCKMVHEKFKNNYQLVEIRNLLDISDIFDKDSPNSIGKRLLYFIH